MDNLKNPIAAPGGKPEPRKRRSSTKQIVAVMLRGAGVDSRPQVVKALLDYLVREAVMKLALTPSPELHALVMRMTKAKQ